MAGRPNWSLASHVGICIYPSRTGLHVLRLVEIWRLHDSTFSLRQMVCQLCNAVPVNLRHMMKDLLFWITRDTSGKANHWGGVRQFVLGLGTMDLNLSV